MKKELKVGDKVKVINNIDIYGNKIEQYDEIYTITNIEGSYIELSTIKNNMLYKWAVLKKNNVKKVEE